MSRHQILHMLCDYDDDLDVTNEVGLSFRRSNPGQIGQFNLKPKAHTKKLSQVPEAEDAELPEDGNVCNELKWLCGGKCGTMVTRDKAKCFMYKPYLPKEVFCSSCSKKVRMSWRAKQCRGLNCKNHVEYYEHIVQVLAKPVPDLCDDCKDAKMAGNLKTMTEPSTWCRKKCEFCKK